MIPKEILYAVRLVVILALVAALWWAGDSFVDWIRAPAIAETNKAVAANQSLHADNQRLVETNARLSQLLIERSEREGVIDRRLDAVQQALDALKKTNPRVKAWAETEIPPEILR